MEIPSLVVCFGRMTLKGQHLIALQQERARLIEETNRRISEIDVEVEQLLSEPYAPGAIHDETA